MRHVDALSSYPAIFAVESGILLQIRKAQSEDETCRAISELLKEREFEDYVVRGGVLYKFICGNYLLVTPKHLQRNIIRHIHEQGHINAKKVESIVRQEYFIPNLPKKIEAVLSNCVAFILASKKMGKPEGVLNPIEKTDLPLRTYHMDHLGPLPATAKNYRYIFVVMDAFTKFSWLYPVKSTTTEEVLRKLQEQSLVFGNPYRIITDRGTAFTSNSFQSYCQEQKINHVLITTGIPRGNGQVERLNRTIIAVLSKMSVDEPQKWFKYVPRLQQILNSTTSRATGKSPFELMLGVKMSRAEDLDLVKLLEEEIINEFETNRSELRKEAKQQIEKVQAENRKYSRRKRKPARIYKVHDLVALKRTQFTPGSKLYPKFLGPYEVVKVKSNDRYDLKKAGDHEGPTITSSAADHMKPWHSIDESEDSSEADDPQDGRM